MLNTAPIVAKTLRADFKNLRPGTAVTLGEILFQKIEAVTVVKTVQEVPKAKAIVEEPEDPNQLDFSKMDIRVGVIRKIRPHDTAERLYCAEV